MEMARDFTMNICQYRETYAEIVSRGRTEVNITWKALEGWQRLTCISGELRSYRNGAKEKLLELSPLYIFGERITKKLEGDRINLIDLK